jgi:hypothetical protein
MEFVFSQKIEEEAWQAYLDNDFLKLSELFSKGRPLFQIDVPIWREFAAAVVARWETGEVSTRAVDGTVAFYLPLNQFRNDKIAGIYLTILCINNCDKGIEYQCIYNTKFQLARWYYFSLCFRNPSLTLADMQILQLIPFEAPIDSPVVFHLVRLATLQHIRIFLNRNSAKWNSAINRAQEKLRQNLGNPSSS